jgi:large subunit ribosomal protein L17
MRHRKSGRKLNRTTAHRKATLANLSAALFERKHIKTTEAKAKETRRVAERLITLAKKDSIHARRLALKQLRHKRIVKILFDDIAPQYTDRSSGYTRVVKLGQRSGDGARMAVLELVGYEMASKKKKEKEKREKEKEKKEKEKETKAEAKKKKRVKGEEVEETTPTAGVEEEKQKGKKTPEMEGDDKEEKEQGEATVGKKEKRDKKDKLKKSKEKKKK